MAIRLGLGLVRSTGEGNTSQFLSGFGFDGSPAKNSCMCVTMAGRFLLPPIWSRSRAWQKVPPRPSLPGCQTNQFQIIVREHFLGIRPSYSDPNPGRTWNKNDHKNLQGAAASLSGGSQMHQVTNYQEIILLTALFSCYRGPMFMFDQPPRFYSRGINPGSMEFNHVDWPPAAAKASVCA